MIDEHAKVHRPSSLSRTIQCTGWVQLSMDIEEPETEEAREGTASHYVAEQMIKSVIESDTQTKLRMDFVNQTAPNGVVITDDMVDGAEFIVRDVLSVMNQHGLKRHTYVEQRVDIPQIHPDCFGTDDVFMWNPTTETLYVWDYKYGHVSVLAYQNYQLMAYAMGAMNMLGVTPKSIVLRIVQPRCYDGYGPVREWVIDVNILRNHINHAYLRTAEADGINATLTPGPECKNCPGRIRCTALKQSTSNIIPVVQLPVNVDEPDSLWLSVEYTALVNAQSLLKSRMDAIEAEMKRRMLNGENIPGYAQEPAYTRDNWKKPADEIISVCQLMGVDPRKPDALLTPNQVTAQLKKIGVDPSVISDYYGKERTGFKLVKDASAKARIIFKEANNG